MSACIHLSIVSHGQAELVHVLLQDLERFCHSTALQVTLTLNIPEPLPFSATDFSFPLILIRNDIPKGFGANHNAAFLRTRECAWFCVINPDIRLQDDAFGPLLATLESDSTIGLTAPLVRNPLGEKEDSARRLPTPLTILAKAAGHVEAPCADEKPDWVAGMFMLFPVHVFKEIRGFDERYHLYYEDVDLCCRLRLAGYTIRLVKEAQVIHAARRESHHNLLYMRWHLASMARFFTSRVFFQCRRLLK